VKGHFVGKLLSEYINSLRQTHELTLMSDRSLRTTKVECGKSYAGMLGLDLERNGFTLEDQGFAILALTLCGLAMPTPL